MDAMIVVDMQAGPLAGPPKHDLDGVIARINRLTEMLRSRGGRVIWIRHCGTDDEFARGRPGWEFLPQLDHASADAVVEKTLNDAFAGTGLQATLAEIALHDHNLVVVSDGHTLSDRPHLDAAAVIRHHNWVWSNLITQRSVRLATTAELLSDSWAS